MRELLLPNLDSIRWPNECFLCGAAAPGKVHVSHVARGRDIGVPVCEKDFRKLRLAGRIARLATVAIVLLFVALGIGSFWLDIPLGGRFAFWLGAALACLALETAVVALVQSRVIGNDADHGLPLIDFDRKTRQYRMILMNDETAAAMRRINIERTEIGYSTEKGYPVIDIGMGMPLGARARLVGEKIEIADVPYTLAINVERLCELARAGEDCALPLTNLKFPEALAALEACLRGLSDRAARGRLSSLRLVCVGCGWEIPEIYRQSLAATVTGSADAARAAIGYGEFGAAGKCPRCGSTSSYLILKASASAP